MNLYLVRHGEAAASWGEHPDPGLSALGHKQASQASDQLLTVLTGGTRLYSSPLARAQETAQPLASALDQAPLIDDRIREVPSPVSMAQRQDWLRAFMKQRWAQQPQSLLACRLSALDLMQEQASDAVFFTHFLVINAIVGAVLSEQATLHFWPDNGSITHLRLEGDSLELVALGQSMKTVVN